MSPLLVNLVPPVYMRRELLKSCDTTLGDTVCTLYICLRGVRKCGGLYLILQRTQLGRPSVTINSLLLYIGRGIIICCGKSHNEGHYKGVFMKMETFRGGQDFFGPLNGTSDSEGHLGAKKVEPPLKVKIFMETPLKWPKLWLFQQQNDYPTPI